jgi:hypothetical protein
MFILSEYGRSGNRIFANSDDYLCPCCKSGHLIYRDHCKRKIVYVGGAMEWLDIPRHQCDDPDCGRISRMIPDILTPYKHYAEETISDTVDGIITPEENDYRPSEGTAKRWSHWMMANEDNINGYLKSIGHRLLGFSEELLRSETSLLSELRKKQPTEWLKTVVRTIYNAGAKLDPCYD